MLFVLFAPLTFHPSLKRLNPAPHGQIAWVGTWPVSPSISYSHQKRQQRLTHSTQRQFGGLDKLGNMPKTSILLEIQYGIWQDLQRWPCDAPKKSQHVGLIDIEQGSASYNPGAKSRVLPTF